MAHVVELFSEIYLGPLEIKVAPYVVLHIPSKSNTGPNLLKKDLFCFWREPKRMKEQRKGVDRIPASAREAPALSLGICNPP